MSTIEVKVPDIGGFKDVPVIDVLVKPGDAVKPEDSLVTLESDKATMDVPSPAAGVVASIAVKLGDKVSEGSLLLTLDGTAADNPADAEPAAAKPAPAAEVKAEKAPRPGPSSMPGPAAASYAGAADIECRMLVIGAGPGGYSAAFRAADLGLKTVLIERYPVLGGVCLNVGCIPSKALLHAAKVIDEAEEMSHFGVVFPKPAVDLAALRGWKESVVRKLTGGLASLARQRKVTVITGAAAFLDAHHVDASGPDGRKQVVKFDQCIIAAGSQAVKVPFIPDDPRVVDSTGALELRGLPARMLVIGGGIIGMEMAQVYSALGAKITVVEMLAQLMTGADPDLVRPFAKRMEKRYEAIMLKTRVTRVEARKDGLEVWFEGEQAPPEPALYERVLVAVGRSPNGGRITAERAGVIVDRRGFIPVDDQLRSNVTHIFAIGDVARPPMLAHKAVHEGHVAAEAAAGEKSFFDARVIPSVAYTDPEVAWVGVTEEDAKANGVQYGKATFPWAASGRSLSLGRDEGITKLLFDQGTHRIIGGGIVGPHAGDLIAEVALAIEMGCNAEDIGKTIHPHPTLSETVGMAAEAFAGTITDLYLPKKN